jgi:hypothetical protein
MRFPDAQTGKTQVEMLASLPRLTMLVIEVQPYHNIIVSTEQPNVSLSTFKTNAGNSGACHMDVASSQSPECLIDTDKR